MESNKNKFETLKLLLDDLFDTLNESNLSLLQQMEDLKKENVVLNEKIDGYKESIENLQERLSYLEISDALRERDKMVMDPFASEDNPNEELADEAAEAESEPEDDEPSFILGGDDDIEDNPDTFYDTPNAFHVASDTKSEMAPPVSEPVFPASVQPVDLWQPSEKEKHEQESKLIMDTVRPDWYDWEVDYPAPYLEDIATGIGFNDKLLFLKELFGSNEEEFSRTIKVINEMEHFQQATDYIREHYQHWDEQSDVVYRFYMNVRRKLRK